jgi:hypothetical protein
MESLRNAAERLIVEPYKNRRVENKINVIAAPTGVGKTFSIMHKLIPYDIEQGFKKFIVLTVYRDNVMQDFYAYQDALYREAHVTTDIEYFVNYSGKTPIVFISTIAGSSTGGSKTDVEHQNDQKLLRVIAKQKVAVYWDEAHFGGSSNKRTFGPNTGCGPGESTGYNASYYGLIEDALIAGAKVTGFTATPLFEQQLLLENLSNKQYALLTNPVDWPTIGERTEIGSQYKDIHFYDTNMSFDYSMKKFLIDFYIFSENFSNRANMLNEYDSQIGALKKPVMLIATGRENTKSGIEMSPAIESILSFYKGKIDDEDFFIGTATQNGYYLYNTKGDRKNVKQGTFFSAISDDDNPLRIVMFIEKFKFGLNLANVTHEIHLRERSSTQDSQWGRVTVPVIQTFGRAVRTWFGVKNDILTSVFVSDAVEYLNKYAGTKVYDVLREHMLYANSHTFYVPDNDMFRESVNQWKDRYAVPLSLSQFYTTIYKPSFGLPFEVEKDSDLGDACPVCKRPFNQHEELDHDIVSNSLGLAA